MMNVGFYSHTIDFAGTWRSHERLIEEISKNPEFKTYILYCENIENNRLDLCRKLLANTTFVPFTRSLVKTGPSEGYTPIETNFKQVCSGLNLDILHFARSGYYEWPFNERHARLQVETNIFGYDDYSPFLDRSIAIATVLTQIKKKPADALISIPIPLKSADYDNLKDLREEYGFTPDDIVLGRMGRPANFHPIALAAFAEVKKTVPNLKYLIVGGCDQAKEFVSKNGLKDVVFAPPTNDDFWIERFHKTINVFAHYRSDGEIHSAALAQALMYEVPVLTHVAGLNGQIETVGPGGFCAHSTEEYTNTLRQFAIMPSAKRKSIGVKGRVYTEERSEQKKIGKITAQKYIEWLNKTVNISL